MAHSATKSASELLSENNTDMEDVLNYRIDGKIDLSNADFDDEISKVERPEVACYAAYLGAIVPEVAMYSHEPGDSKMTKTVRVY